MSDEVFAYAELELAGTKALADFGVSFFSELPDAKQGDLLALQERVLNKHNLQNDDFFADSPFIALD